jgi:hypothetical protein
MLLASATHVSSRPGGADNVIQGRFPEPSPDPWDIFVSYCEKDRPYWKRIELHLTPLRRAGVKIYSYDTLEAGAIVSDEARSALLTSVVTVLLISIDYLASDLMESEFPDLLDQAEQRGVRMLWILTGRCDLSTMGRLTRYHQVCPRAAPLSRIRSPKQDEIYVELILAIRKQLESSGRFRAQ